MADMLKGGGTFRSYPHLEEISHPRNARFMKVYLILVQVEVVRDFLQTQIIRVNALLINLQDHFFAIRFLYQG